MRITVSDHAGERLDVFLTRELPDLSRSRIQSLIKSGHILLNDAKPRPKDPVAAGDHISVELPEPEPSEVRPQDIPLDILFEDDELLVINKPVGMVVHPAVGNPDGTLVNALLHHCKGELPGIGGVERPGIVHRLDKDTSGCIVAAKTEPAQQALLDQFANRETTKFYLCATQRPPTQPDGTIFTHIGPHTVAPQKMAVLDPGGGRPAITDYRVLGRDEDTNTGLVFCALHTGRTHQIRVHMKHIGCPLLGDPIYAQPARQPGAPTRLMLHAWRLGLHHPVTGKPLINEAPVPPEFAPWLTPEVLDTLAHLRHLPPKEPSDA